MLTHVCDILHSTFAITDYRWREAGNEAPNLVHLGIIGCIWHYVPKSVNLEAPHCIAFDHLPIVIRQIQFRPIYTFIVLHHWVQAGRQKEQSG